VIRKAPIAFQRCCIPAHLRNHKYEATRACFVCGKKRIGTITPSHTAIAWSELAVRSFARSSEQSPAGNQSSRGSLVIVAAQNSKKRERTSERNRLYNKPRKSAVATRIKKVTCCSAQHIIPLSSFRGKNFVFLQARTRALAWRQCTPPILPAACPHRIP